MDLQTVLLQPIPDLSDARRVKPGYREHPLLTTVGERDDEPLVNIEEYGLAGQSYYSRPNNATSDPVPGVAAAVYVRRGIAEKLAAINYELQKSEVVEDLLGGRVELYLDDGYRDPALQKKLYTNVFPYIIRQQHPDWTDREVLDRRDQLSARPPMAGTPSPHATGAAVDIKLRFCHENPRYVPGIEVPMGHRGADTSSPANPDHYEQSRSGSTELRTARQNRRIFYWIMKGALNGDDSGFVVNPTEWWHWSYGDQMWARLTQAPGAFYGQAELPETT